MSGALEYCLWWVTFVRNGFCPQGTISTIRRPQWDKDQIFKTFFFSYFYIIYRKQLLSSLTNVDNSLAALLVIDKIDSTHCHFHLNPFAFDLTEKSIFCCFVFDFCSPLQSKAYPTSEFIYTMASKFKSLDSSSSTEQQNYKHIKWKL